MEPIRFEMLDWHAWQPTEDTPEPDVSFIKPLLRRRLGALDRIALACAQACHPGHNIPTVFSSRHGETHRTIKLLQSLAQAEDPSPTAFGLSVHNAAAGLYSIAFNDTAPSTTMAAGADSLPAALLEALVQSRRGNTAVLLVYAEESVPEPYHPYLAGQPLQACGLAMRLRWNPGGPWQMTRYTAANQDPYQAALQALHDPADTDSWLQRSSGPC